MAPTATQHEKGTVDVLTLNGYKFNLLDLEYIPEHANLNDQGYFIVKSRMKVTLFVKTEEEQETLKGLSYYFFRTLVNGEEVFYKSKVIGSGRVSMGLVSLYLEDDNQGIDLDFDQLEANKYYYN